MRSTLQIAQTRWQKAAAPKAMSSSDPVIENMRSRAAQCRRLANETHDERMRWQLLEWANQIESDVVRLEEERTGHKKEGGREGTQTAF